MQFHFFKYEKNYGKNCMANLGAGCWSSLPTCPAGRTGHGRLDMKSSPYLTEKLAMWQCASCVPKKKGDYDIRVLMF